MNKLSIAFSVLAFSLLSFYAQAQVKKPVVKKATTSSTAKKPVAKKATTTAKPVTAKVFVPKRLPGTRVKVTTDSGVIIIRLYDKTVKHRDNFIKLVNEKFFDSLIFHRVISQFMIQGGDPQSKNAVAGAKLGNGDVGYTIPAEFDTAYYHKKGALAAARTDNPEKASSGCQFYIVQGKKYSEMEITMLETQMGSKFSAKKRTAYQTIGGTPFLDMNYTVFGEVESGLDVIDKIASVPKGMGDRPIGDIRMYIEVIK